MPFGEHGFCYNMGRQIKYNKSHGDRAYVIQDDMGREIKDSGHAGDRAFVIYVTGFHFQSICKSFSNVQECLSM